MSTTEPKATTNHAAVASRGAASGSPPQTTPQGAIALRLRSRRRACGMTLDQLAAATGLNKGYLSRLERGEKGPSIATVIKLAHALDSSVSYLFGETIDEDAIHVSRALPRAVVEAAAGHPSYAILSHGQPGSQTEAFLMIPPPEFGDQGHATHGGEELFFVKAGRVEVEFANGIVALAEGDFMQFPGHMPHRVRRVSADAAVLVIVAGR